MNSLSTTITAVVQSLSVHETDGASKTINNLLQLNLEDDNDNIVTVSTTTQQQIPHHNHQYCFNPHLAMAICFHYNPH